MRGLMMVRVVRLMGNGLRGSKPSDHDHAEDQQDGERLLYQAKRHSAAPGPVDRWYPTWWESVKHQQSERMVVPDRIRKNFPVYCLG
jgi:hypothetical protein